ncbi:hypothetical protein [Celerinatantimonas yamalensis]|uniref:Uncharacterized protein n=1 Tax=Celerinatantimonas yamalensis TaxID=559956 RepID=A0ABW9GB15_9GAMM
MAVENRINASNLLQIGTKRLSLLGKHAQALMQGYVDGYIEETALSELALKKLVDARLVWRPSAQHPLALRPLVSELIASMVADENRRQINADVAEKLEQIRIRVQAYHDAQARGDYAMSELQLQRLTEHVHDLSGQFEEAIDSLWHRLNSDFGFVSSLDDKIRENERAQKQLRRLLDGLELLDFTELIALSEGSSQLRKLLVSGLQNHFSDHHSSLLEVQKRLVVLMAKFRQQQSRSLLIANMAAFLREHPHYQPIDYPHRTIVPELFNQAKAIQPAAAVALDKTSDYHVLAELSRAIPRPVTGKSLQLPSASALPAIANEPITLRQQALKQDVENFYLHAIESAQALRALDYLASQKLSWDGEIWLYQIIAEYQSLPRRIQRQLSLHYDEKPASSFNQLQLIVDITMKVRSQ